MDDGAAKVLLTLAQLLKRPEVRIESWRRCWRG